jgi:hypothetical protein
MAIGAFGSVGGVSLARSIERDGLGKMADKITDVTRRDIVDYISAAPIDWGGRLGDLKFLARLYNLAELPSFDTRFSTADEDIFQHTVRNEDWEADWVFTDRRFNVMWAPDSDFLRFLAETVHPAVRPDTQAAREIVASYNHALLADGWMLEESAHLSGRPMFRPVEVTSPTEVMTDLTGRREAKRNLPETRERLLIANRSVRENRAEWDVFISHASEDKDAFVRPLARALGAAGLQVWFDESTLTIGDSLHQKIDEGLASSRYGVVVLSHAFFAKQWPRNELDGLVAKEVAGQKVILPVWLDVDHGAIVQYSPMLAGKLAARESEGLTKVVADILAAIGARVPLVGPARGKIAVVRRPSVGLSAGAVGLLTEAAEDKSGIILVVETLGRLSVQTNGKDFVAQGSPRSEAIGRAMLKELVAGNLIEDSGLMGEVFVVTAAGYELADSLAI